MGRMRISVPVGEGGGASLVVVLQKDWRESRTMWRLKFRKPWGSFVGGEVVKLLSVRLSERSLGEGEVGLVAGVQKLLFLVLPLFEEAEELLVLELIFRRRLKAPILLMGGLDAIEGGGSESCDSGAA